jgi:putative IMPACT (imprinted ancient) family translation regulator
MKEKLLSLFEKGQGIIFVWIEFLRENMHLYLTNNNENNNNHTHFNNNNNNNINNNNIQHNNNNNNNNHIQHNNNNMIIKDVCEQEEDSEIDGSIMSGEPLTDRKSKFQAFICQVFNINDVRKALNLLLTYKKIANATHNMYAYRMVDNNGIIHEEREDDGEGGAGDKILYVLKNKKAENIMVVVSRWFGGINLGQARFKHITNCTIDILTQFKSNPHSQSQNNNKNNNNNNSLTQTSTKFRTAETIYNHILWNENLKKRMVIIGFINDLVNNEINFDNFLNLKLSYQSVLYFKIDDIIIWDKMKRIDSLK